MKKTILIIVGILLVALVAGGIYLWQKNKKISLTSAPTSKSVDWESLFPDIQVAFLQASPNLQVEGLRYSIFEEADITGDGIPEALVKTTWPDNYSTLTLVKIKDGKPILPLFKDVEGITRNTSWGTPISPNDILKMSPDKNALYSSAWVAGNTCWVQAFQWNAQTEIFEYNPDLSEEVGQDYCPLNSRI